MISLIVSFLILSCGTIQYEPPVCFSTSMACLRASSMVQIHVDFLVTPSRYLAELCVSSLHVIDTLGHLSDDFTSTLKSNLGPDQSVLPG